MDWIYQAGSLITTSLGFLFLGLTTMSELEHSANFATRVQALCVKWTVFIGFICVQPLLFQIMYLFPLGRIIVMIAKVFVILPENRVSKWIFEKTKVLGSRFITKQSSFGSILKQISIFVSVFLLSVAKHLIRMTKTQDAAVIQRNIKSCHQLLIKPPQQQIIIQDDEDSDSPTLSKKPSVITVNKVRVYELQARNNKFQVSKEILIKYEVDTRCISFISQSQKIEAKLEEIKYMSQDLMRLQLVLDNEHSYPIQLKEEWQVQGWVKPVVKSLKLE